MPSYKLTYFDGRYNTETTRLMFGASGTEFEDIRLGMDYKDFYDLKSTGSKQSDRSARANELI